MVVDHCRAFNWYLGLICWRWIDVRGLFRRRKLMAGRVVRRRKSFTEAATSTMARLFECKVGGELCPRPAKSHRRSVRQMERIKFTFRTPARHLVTWISNYYFIALAKGSMHKCISWVQMKVHVKISYVFFTVIYREFQKRKFLKSQIKMF